MSLYIFPDCRKWLHVQFSGAWIKISAMGDFDFIAGAYVKGTLHMLSKSLSIDDLAVKSV